MARSMNNRGFAKGHEGSSIYKGFPHSTDNYGFNMTNTKTLAPMTDVIGSAAGLVSGMKKRSGSGSGAYNQMLEAYQSKGLAPGLTDWLDQKKALAQQAYDKSMGMLNGAFGEYMGALAANLESTKGALADTYNRSKQSINEDATQSLKQAYINKMLSEKNINQQMSAQGLSGGASETTRAGMLNNYGNARNDINAQKARNLSQLEGQYNENVAAAMSAYNQAAAAAGLQKAQQAIELENALANNEMAAMDDFWDMMGGDTDAFLNALGGTLENQDYTYEPTQANNKPRGIDFTQANKAGQRSYNNLLQALQEMMGRGQQMTYRGSQLPANYITQLLNYFRG